MPLSVEIASELADWPDVDFVLAASSEPSVYDREQLDRLLIGWYDVGVHGGYGPSDNPNGKGVLHNMTEPSYSDDEDGFRITWRTDMGSAPDRALDVLIRALEGWSEYARLSAARLMVR